MTYNEETNWLINATDIGINREGRYNCSPYIQKVKLKHEQYKGTRIEPLEIKAIMSGTRNALLRINSRLDIAKQNISKHEDTALETIQNEVQRRKK